MATELQELVNQNAELLRMLREVQSENKLLHQKIQLLIARIFGRKTEKLDPNQLELLMGGVDVEISLDPDDDPPPSSPSPGKKKRRKNKPRIPENLPTEDIHLNRSKPSGYDRLGKSSRELVRSYI